MKYGRKCETDGSECARRCWTSSVVVVAGSGGGDASTPNSSSRMIGDKRSLFRSSSWKSSKSKILISSSLDESYRIIIISMFTCWSANLSKKWRGSFLSFLLVDAEQREEEETAPTHYLIISLIETYQGEKDAQCFTLSITVQRRSLSLETLIDNREKNVFLSPFANENSSISGLEEEETNFVRRRDHFQPGRFTSKERSYFSSALQLLELPTRWRTEEI